MFGKELIDINTKKTYKPNYFNENGLISSNNIYSFYMKKNIEGVYHSSVEFFLLEINKINYEEFNYYRVKPNHQFNFNKKFIYFLFSKKKILLKKTKISKLKQKKGTIRDIRYKYWGKIITLFNFKNLNIAAKLIYMKQNTQSSLEYHLFKSESYFILDGKINLGLRYSRANQSLLVLNKYNSFDMLPGVMHMRMSKQNSLIIEVSSYDNDL